MSNAQTLSLSASGDSLTALHSILQSQPFGDSQPRFLRYMVPRAGSIVLLQGSTQQALPFPLSSGEQVAAFLSAWFLGAQAQEDPEAEDETQKVTRGWQLSWTPQVLTFSCVWIVSG